MGVSEYIITKLYNEDKDFIKNARIDKVLKISDRNIGLIIYNKGKSKTLLISLEANLPLYLLGESLISFVEETNGFFATLKRHIEFGNIYNFEKVENDRIVKFNIRKRLPTFVYEETTLIFEMIPLRTNLILVDKNNVIIDAFHKSQGFDEKNPIIKGAKYFIKEFPNKKINKNDSLEELKYKVSRKEYEYLSSLDDLKRKEMLDLMLSNNDYYILKSDISSLPLQDSKKLKKDEIIEYIIKSKEKEGRDNHFKTLINFVDKKVKSLSKKVINLKNDLEKCEHSEIYKDYGTLLYYGSSNYKKGDESVLIEGVNIPLKKDKDLNQNAALYFKKYKKAKSGIIALEEQIEKTKKELSYFCELQIQIKYGKEDDLKQVIMQLENDNYLKSQKMISKKKNKPQVFTPHMVIYNGVKISYGLSSFQNDYLTFTLAHKEDTFLHIKDYHGPHVIIFSDNVSDDVLLFASELSLYFANKTSGEVLYAKRKNIKKIPAKTGMVELKEYKEIHIASLRKESISILERLN